MIFQLYFVILLLLQEVIKHFTQTFYLKCCDVLRKSKIKYEKNIFFISPPITKQKDNFISSSDIFDNLSKVKQKELLKKYNIDEEDIDFFLPKQTEKIGSCGGFAGTKISADLYHMILY